MNDEGSLHSTLVQLVPALDEAPDWEDVLRRAGVSRHPAAAAEVSPLPRRLPTLRFGRRRVTIAAIAFAMAVAGTASAVAYHYLGPSPGFTAGISAFDRLPPVTAAPAGIPSVGLDRSAAYAGISPAQAVARLRLLQSGLSQGDLYAFEGDNGTVCVFLTGHFGKCLSSSNTRATEAHAGVLATISPGYPNESPAVVAVVADNVAAVDLVIDGAARNIPIVNNSIYAELGGLKPTDTISLNVRYADNSERTFPLLNPAQS